MNCESFDDVCTKLLSQCEIINFGDGGHLGFLNMLIKRY